MHALSFRVLVDAYRLYNRQAFNIGVTDTKLWKAPSLHHMYSQDADYFFSSYIYSQHFKSLGSIVQIGLRLSIQTSWGVKSVKIVFSFYKLSWLFFYLTWNSCGRIQKSATACFCTRTNWVVLVKEIRWFCNPCQVYFSSNVTAQMMWQMSCN